MHRFFAPDARDGAITIDLPEDEATHLTRVLRLPGGAVVSVFNGRGGEWRGTVRRADSRAVSIDLAEALTPAPESALDLTLAVAVLKGDKMDDVVRDAVMMGVGSIVPVLTARTEISAAALERGRRLARWQRIAISSTKQCGRAVVPTIAPPCALAEAWPVAPTVIMLVEPRAGVQTTRLPDLPRSPAAALLIGPEGGWTDDEVHGAAGHGAILLTLGGQTVRADAMPVVALTALRVHWGDL